MEKGYYIKWENKCTWWIVVAIHNKNGKGLLRISGIFYIAGIKVAIHNKNGKGLLQRHFTYGTIIIHFVAIHNKNGKGLLPDFEDADVKKELSSQSTIKMEKGYYLYCKQ